jgi:hypothetical protein
MNAALDAVLERDWQKTVRELAATLGYRRAYHTFDSRRSDTGFPDLVLVRDRVVFLELKRERGKLTEQQKVWVRALVVAEAEVYVVRPRHFELLATVLGPLTGPRYRAARKQLFEETFQAARG